MIGQARLAGNLSLTNEMAIKRTSMRNNTRQNIAEAEKPPSWADTSRVAQDAVRLEKGPEEARINGWNVSVWKSSTPCGKRLGRGVEQES